MSGKGQTSEKDGLLRAVRSVGISVWIGTVCAALVLLLMAFILSARNVPQFAVQPMAAFALLVGGFTAGFSCAKLMRENGLIFGAVCGGVLIVIMQMAGFAVPDNAFGLSAVIKIAVVLISAMLGGVLGVNTRHRRKVKK